MSPVSPVFYANILHCRTSEVDHYPNSHILLSLDLKKYIEIFVITNVRLNYIKYGIVFKMGSHLISLVGASIRCFHRVAMTELYKVLNVLMHRVCFGKRDQNIFHFQTSCVGHFQLTK